MSKKLKFLLRNILITFLIFFISWVLINFTIGNDKFSFIKSLAGNNVKSFVKKYFFTNKFVKDLEIKEKKKNEFYLSLIRNSSFDFKKNDIQNLKEKRKLILDYHILNENEISYKKIDNYNKNIILKKINLQKQEIQEIQSNYEINLYSVFFYKLRDNAIFLKLNNCKLPKKIFIFIGGHNGLKKYKDKIINNLDFFNKNCIDLLLLDLPSVGINKYNINWKKKFYFQGTKEI